MRSASLILATALAACAPAVPTDRTVDVADTVALETGFRTPPQSARPQVWWHLMSGNVTEEGAKLDIEWMQRVGVGGIHAFSGGQLEPTVVPTPAPFMSDIWKKTYRASVAQARAADMDVAITGSPGWSQTGGPWVKPEQGMKKYVWTVTEVTAPGGPIVLPRPSVATGKFAGITGPSLGGTAASEPHASGDGPVIAFRTLDISVDLSTATYNSSAGPLPALASLPADLSSSVSVPIAKAGDTFVDVDLGKAAAISALSIASEPLSPLEILASDDGVTFKSVRRVDVDDSVDPLVGAAPQQTVAFAPVTGRVFRVRFDKPAVRAPLQGLPEKFATLMVPKYSAFKVRTLRLGNGAWVERFENKAGFQASAEFSSDPTPDIGGAIQPQSVVDLTNRLKADGSLDWAPPPPAGRWTIVRFGWSLTGAKNSPAEPAATGLEVDKLDRIAVRDYVEKLFSIYRDDAGAPLGSQGINSLLTDSWEVGVQNWAPNILAEFRRLRGYDPTPWLPVLAGRVVGDASRSDAFLFDFRQTLKDLLVENHYGELAAAAHRQGMTYYTEVQGDSVRAIADGMTAKARADIPTAEFWYRPFATSAGQPPLVADLQEAASAAHIYGKKLVAAEALTVAAGDDPWAFSPAMLKPVADEIFARGVNRILIHDSHMQPFTDRKPGLMLGLFGQFFNRNDTWAEQAKPWTDYLARTSYLLQQGQYVADIAYFYGEEKSLAELFEHRQNTDVPGGYGFDYVNAEALLTKLSVRDGKLVTASGMQYRVLFVPVDVTHFTLPALKKLDALIRDGAVVVAHKPVGGFGMKSSDADIAKLANKLWGESGEAVRTVGHGRLYTNATLAEALTAENITPDVDASKDVSLLSLHRRIVSRDGSTDLYFVSNRSDAPVTTPVSFRVTGRAPEWWSAEDGKTRPLSYSQAGDVTRVTLPLDTKTAGFVVFRQPTTATTQTVAPPTVVVTQPIDGAWDISFESGRGAPPTARFERLADWSQNPDAGIKYFSGAATYSKTITVDAAALAAGRRITLDLGDVRELAVVTVNDTPIGTAWHEPYTIDLTGKLKPGANRINIQVVNLWPNRLIGDKQPGATAVAYAPQSPYTAGSPLRPSGLLGPVKLRVSADPLLFNDSSTAADERFVPFATVGIFSK